MIATDGHQNDPASQKDMSRRHRSVAAWCAGIVLTMTAAAFAAVPLYDLFCRVTGYGGATMRASAPSSALSGRTIAIRFDANVRQVPWTFEPVARRLDVKLGENALAYYRATNTSNRSVTGTASYNVTPEIAGGYFNKVECFCFQEQTLAPGESIEMPVSFFIDPSIDNDRDARRLGDIVLSYTFHPVTKAAAARGPQNSADPAKAADGT